MTNLLMHAGKGNKRFSLDIKEIFAALGLPKSRGLLGFHHFTGSDYGGKFVGISKKKWTEKYLQLNEESEILVAFSRFGSFTSDQLSLTEIDDLNEAIKPLEEFVCLAYAKDGAKTLSALRWDLFRTKNLESELLLPTRATLLPHIQRTNYLCLVGRSYSSTHPDLPALTDCGWRLDEKDGSLVPYNLSFAYFLQSRKVLFNWSSAHAKLKTRVVRGAAVKKLNCHAHRCASAGTEDAPM